MLKRKVRFPSIVLFLLLSFPCLSWAWSGKVVGVAEGDIMTVMKDGKEVRIMLYGIDTPEPGQAFDEKAKQVTSDMVLGKEVLVESLAEDRHGLIVGLIFVGKRLVNEELVKAGLAWVYWKHCHQPICEGWKNFQLRAKFDKRGLWADPDPVPPWEFRRRRGKK